MPKGPKFQFNVFERIESVKRILEPVVPDRNSFKLRGLVLRCTKYRVKLIKGLSEIERKTYDLLLKHKLNPKTVYEWLLLEDVPHNIKEKLVKNTISFEDARHQYVQWKRMSGTRAGAEIMDEMRNIIRRIRWKSQE